MWPERTPSDGEIEVVLDREAEEEARLLVRARHPELGARARGRSVVSAPRNSIVPDVGGTSPEMTLNSVVLPAPFGPRMARRSP